MNNLDLNVWHNRKPFSFPSWARGIWVTWRREGREWANLHSHRLSHSLPSNLFHSSINLKSKSKLNFIVPKQQRLVKPTIDQENSRYHQSIQWKSSKNTIFSHLPYQIIEVLLLLLVETLVYSSVLTPSHQL